MKAEDSSDYADCIRDAIDAIKEAQSKLDLGSRRCPNCGSVRYNTWADKQSSNHLGGALTRLETLIK